MDLAIRLGERLASTKDPHATLALGELAAATGRDDDAVTLFRTVGESADDPVTLPWRAGVALGLMRSRWPPRGGRPRHRAPRPRARPPGRRTPWRVRCGPPPTCLMVDRADRLREAHDLARDRFDRLAAQVATDLAGLIALTTAAEVERAEAVTLLRAAEEYADTEDLWPLHTRVRRLLERFGETPRTPRAEIIARLTESELRVARLAALGGTNRAIAERRRRHRQGRGVAPLARLPQARRPRPDRAAPRAAPGLIC